jgi:pyrimidine-specific ribonucleoside hydrolase
MTPSTAPEAIPVILDVDTGVDDALAILFALAHPGINVLGISCVAGNASLERVVENTLRILDVADAPLIPVAAGARRPLIEPARSAAHVHGEGGLGTLQLPPTDRRAESVSSIELMHTLIQGSPHPVTLVGLAPQTNLALLLRQYPDVIDNIERIVFMGGSTTVGNATAVAEFNVWHDPEAAAIVLDSGVPTFMYGLDVFNQVSRYRSTSPPSWCTANPTSPASSAGCSTTGSPSARAAMPNTPVSSATPGHSARWSILGH